MGGVGISTPTLRKETFVNECGGWFQPTATLLRLPEGVAGNQLMQGRAADAEF